MNKPDKNGSTALFYTIQKNHVVLVKDLIKAGAGEWFNFVCFERPGGFFKSVMFRIDICCNAWITIE